MAAFSLSGVFMFFRYNTVQCVYNEDDIHSSSSSSSHSVLPIVAEK